MTEFEMVSLPGMHRHDQPGYYALADLPQRPSVDTIAQSTGWWELDQIWRLYHGQFTVVTGPAGHGKSTLLFNVLANMAFNLGTRSFLYVPENEQFIRDTLRDIWGERENVQSFKAYCKTHFYVQTAEQTHYEDAPRTLNWVLDKALVAIERDHVDVVLIDPWNELEHAKPASVPMTDYVRDCLRYLKAFSRTQRVSVIVVAHPTKEGVKEGRTPGLYDIEGSAAWVNKADNGLIVMRDAERPAARVISAKCRLRGAGKRGVCHFYVDEATGLFTPQHGAVS